MLGPLKALRAYRRLRRYRTLAVTLVRHGFSDVVDRIGVGGFRRPFRRSAGKRRTLPPSERLRLALEELGPTFVKLGQVLSTRPDVLPADYIEELEKLQDRVPPFPFDDVRRMIQEELGRSPDELFMSLSPTPAASASISQVHKAVLPDGTAVAVKIQRPDIRRDIESDLEIIADVAELIEQHVPELRWFQPRQLASQFARTIRRELDFIAEAQTIERFRDNCSEDSHRFIPHVHWDFTAERVLVIDFIEGVKITHVDKLDELGYDRRAIAHHGAQSILAEVFDHRLFHADPHPGNLFVLPGEVIAVIDFGIVGRLDEETSMALAELLASVVDKDVNTTIAVFDRLDLIGDSVDRALLKADLLDFLDRYHGLPLESLDAELIIQDLLQIIRRHQILLPADLALLARMLILAAGTGRKLDPDFDLVAEARPFVKDFMLRSMDPRRQVKSLTTTIGRYGTLLKGLPGDVEEILGKVKKGKMLVSLHHEGLNRFILEMDRSSNRITFGLIVASLIVGSSLVMQLEGGPRLFGLPLIGLVGYLIAAVLGLWLVVAILRSGRI